MPWKAEVADKDDLMDTVRATKAMMSIKVAVVETVKAWQARGWIHPWSAVHRHSDTGRWCEIAAHSNSGHRISVCPYLRPRSRGCENTCNHATKENEFSPVHSVTCFPRLKPSFRELQ